MKIISLGLLLQLLLFTSCGWLSAISEEKIEEKEEIRIFNGCHLYIKGTVDGVEGNFIFDTGADNLYYDAGFFATNNFSYQNLIETTIGGSGNKAKRVLVVMDTVSRRFGTHTYNTSIVPVLKLKPILGDFSDGIIGLVYFSKVILEINFENEFTNFYSSIDSLDLFSYRKLELERHKNRLYSSVQHK